MAQRFGGETLESYQNYDKMEQEWTNVYAGFNVLGRMVHSQNGETPDADIANLVIALWGALRQFTLYAGRWDEKIQLSALAYTVTSALSKWDDAGWSAYDVSWILYLRDQLDEATVWVERSAQAWAHDVPLSDRAYALRMRALLAQKKKEYVTAEQTMQRALEMWETEKGDFDISVGLHELADFAYERGELKIANAYYQRTLELSVKMNDQESLAAVYGSLGNLYLDRQQVAQAREQFEKELQFADEIGRVDLVASAKFGLARIARLEGNTDRALKLATEAKIILQGMQKALLKDVLTFITELQ